MFGKLAVSSMLREFPAGYIFKPFGELGKSYIVSRSSSRGIVTGSKIFGHTVFPIIAAIVAAYFYYKATHFFLPVIITIGLGLIWMAAFYLWGKLATRGLVENPRYDDGGDNAGR